jgi:hypothetical protein
MSEAAVETQPEEVPGSGAEAAKAETTPTPTPEAGTQETPSEGDPGAVTAPAETIHPAWLDEVLNFRPEVPEEKLAAPDTPPEPDFTDSTLDQATIEQIDRLVERKTAEREAKIREELGATKDEVKRARSAEVERSLSRTADYLDNHFYKKVLAEDPDVMGNPDVRKYVDFFAGKFTQQAVEIARQYGDTGRAEFVESPMFRALVVGGAKELHRIMSGTPSGVTSIEKPTTPKGAHVETSAPSGGGSGVALSKEVRDYLKQEGISEDEYIKEYLPHASDVAYDGDD